MLLLLRPPRACNTKAGRNCVGVDNLVTPSSPSFLCKPRASCAVCVCTLVIDVAVTKTTECCGVFKMSWVCLTACCSTVTQWLTVGVEVLPPHRRLPVKPDVSLLVLFFLCLLIYPPVHLLFLSSSTLPPEDVLPVLVIHSTASTCCSESGSSLRIHSEFDIGYHACKQRCLLNPDCHLFTHGSCLQTVGVRGVPLRCQLYSKCAARANTNCALHEVRGRTAALGLLLLYVWHYACSFVWFFFLPRRAAHCATLLLLASLCGVVVLLTSSPMQEQGSVMTHGTGFRTTSFPLPVPFALTLVHHALMPCLLIVIHAQLKQKLNRTVRREKFSNVRLCELRRLLAETAKQQRGCSSEGSKAVSSLVVTSVGLGLLATTSHVLAAAVSRRSGSDSVANFQLSEWLWGVPPLKAALLVVTCYLLSVATLRRVPAAALYVGRLCRGDDELYSSTNALSSAIYQQELTLLWKLDVAFATFSSELGTGFSPVQQPPAPGYSVFPYSPPPRHAIQIYKGHGVRGTLC